MGGPLAVNHFCVRMQYDPVAGCRITDNFGKSKVTLGFSVYAQLRHVVIMNFPASCDYRGRGICMELGLHKDFFGHKVSIKYKRPLYSRHYSITYAVTRSTYCRTHTSLFIAA